MNCPYCNKEMEAGRIYNGRGRLSWTPEYEEWGTFFRDISKHGVQLGTYSRLTGGETEAFYCESCRKIVIDVNGDK